MSSSEFDTNEPGADDSDTGPLRAYEPAQAVQSAWAGRFDAPLTVQPRQVRSGFNPKPLLITAAAVGAAAVIGGLVFWLTRPSSDGAEPTAAPPPPEPTANAEDEARLLRQLPRGYPADACEPALPSENVLAQVDCAANTDRGGPVSATYTLVPDKAALGAAFDAAVADATRVDCPGRIQSPGPWRRNATPDKVSGQLFCGLRDDRPTVVWTDDAKMTVSVVRAGAQGPTFPDLYAWWSSHS